MNDPGDSVDEEHPRPETVDSIGKRRRLGALVRDCPTDEGRTTHVWGDKLHTPARLLVGQTVALVSEDREQRRTRGRLVERDAHVVHQFLGPHPLPIEPRVEKLVIGKDAGGADGLVYVGETMTRRGGVDLYVLLEIEPFVVRIACTAIVVDITTFSGGVLGVECRRRASNEAGKLREHVGPARWLYRCIVDLAHQR